MKKLATIGRYAVGGLCCFSGSIALFNDVAYHGSVLRAEGLLAKVYGGAFICLGIFLIFKRNGDSGDDESEE